MSDQLPPADDATDPLDERPEEGTRRSPAHGPSGGPNAPDGPEPFDPPALDRYRAHTFHKLGGMGRVWRARDAELGREVAFKEIRPKFADDPAARTRFVFEAEVTGRLDHPAVIPVYGFGRDASGRPFYAMRFVEGQSLHDAIAHFYAPDGPSGAARALALRRLLAHFVTVCRAVDYAHSKGVLHRDLKPLNVMIGHFGETLVVDWGIAKRLRAAAGEPDAAPDAPPLPLVARAGGTVPGRGFGSPQFWSPEQAEGRPHDHDERTDVYGLGAVLFAVLTGASPHPNGKHPPHPPSARGRCPWVDAGIDAIARTAMAHDRAARYQTAAAVAEAVELWLADQPLLAQRAAVEALERAAAEHPSDLALAEQLARQRSNLGLMLSGMGRDADAVGWFRAAADDFGKLADVRNKARLYAEQANCLLALARSFAALERPDAAAAAQKEAAALYRRLIATRPDEYKANYATLMLPPGAVPDAHEPADPFPTIDLTPAGAKPAADADPAASGGTPLGRSTIAGEPNVGFGTPSLVREQQLELSGGYTILGELARGGMGALYLARDNALNRQVVIKALLGNAAHDTSTRARFLNEIRLTASLEHPNIVRVYAHAARSDGTPFLVLEHLNGVTLQRMLDVRPPGWSAELLDPLAQACDGLHYAHTRGVVHRDAKMTNIIVLLDGRAVVLDWGIAKRLGEAEVAAGGEAGNGGRGDPMLTQTGAVLGTPAYLSPEQARGDLRAIGPRTDVYTLGADLFHLVTGRPPTTGPSVYDMLAQVITGDLPRLRDVRPDAPRRLEQICSRAMAPRPEDRYPTAAELAADIRAFLAEPVPRRGWRFWG